MRATTTLIAVLQICAAAGCGGAEYSRGDYQDAEARYHVGELGEPWRRAPVEGGDLAFEAPPLDSLIQVNASCDPALDIPLSSLRNHLLIGFTERQVESEETVPFAGREALVTEVVAKLDGVPRRLRLVVLKKDGCVYDFALVGPTDGRFEQARAAFAPWLAEFSTP